MRTLKVYRHGLTMGTAPDSYKHVPRIRGEVQGWSESATRRNTAFLRSAIETDLPRTSSGAHLTAYAFTLTLRHCPPTSDDWHKLRRAFLMRLNRLGLYRCHWVTEWQRRGVPHLHGAFWFPAADPARPDRIPAAVLAHWLSLTQETYGASMNGQHYTPITDAIGWFKYLSKHASRGIRHYQRNPESIPPEWRKKTGRVWGHTGDWPLSEPIQFELDNSGWFKLRRICRSWRKADARASGQAFRIRQARTMLSCSKPDLSRLRGVSEWIPEHVQMSALYLLRSQGCEIVN